MEPIRPDQDELRAKNTKRRSESGKTEKKPGNGNTRPPRRPEPDDLKKSKKGGPRTGFLAFLLVVVVIVSGLGWYTQAKRIDQLSSKLEQADYWVRQSKLSLARFEGDLSETGENLKQRGSSLEDRVGGIEKQVKTADSEIGKLWAVANERNKEAIKTNQETLAALQENMSEAQKTSDDLKNKQSAESTRLDTLDAGQKDQSETLETLTGTLEAQTVKMDNLGGNLKSMQSSVSGLKSRVAAVEKGRAEQDASVKTRLNRLRREQSLAMDELAARLSRLQKSSDGNGDVKERLQQVEGAIKAIDASRAQLNARLIRLGQEVDTLR